MGKAHTAAYKNVPLIFGNEPAIPVLHTVADINLQSAEETYKYGGFKYFTNDWKKIVDISKDLENLNLYIDDNPILTIPTLRARARRLNRLYGIDLIIIDYFNYY